MFKKNSNIRTHFNTPGEFPSPSGGGRSETQFHHVDQRYEVKNTKNMIHKVQLATLSLFLAFSISAQQQPKKPASNSQPAQAQVQLKTPTDSNQYILGAYLGQYIVSNGFSITNADLFIKGLNDAIGNSPLLVPAESINLKIAEYQNRLSVERSSLLEKQLFESLKNQAGLGMLPNGVYYSILKAGTGSRPLINDSIIINVKGYLPDGKLFEDTYQKKSPYRVVPAGLIPGMNEAIQIMPAGSTWRLFIPSSQAFGEKGLQGLIPPYSAVIFDVELIEVK